MVTPVAPTVEQKDSGCTVAAAAGAGGGGGAGGVRQGDDVVDWTAALAEDCRQAGMQWSAGRSKRRPAGPSVSRRRRDAAVTVR